MNSFRYNSTGCGKFVAVILGLVVAAFGATDAARADNHCHTVPSHLQIEHSFPVNSTLIDALRGHAVIDCSSPRPAAMVVAALAANLAEQDLALEKVTYRDSSDRIMKISVATSGDKAGRGSFILPVQLAGGAETVVESIVGPIRVIGEPIEGSGLKARFPVNKSGLRALKAQTRLSWLRDGDAIDAANRSRYTITGEDIGHRLAVRVDIVNDEGTVLHSARSDETAPVMMAEHLPEIRNLELVGEAYPGETLTARYEFRDRNPDDAEENSQFVWLRDNLAIAGAEANALQLTDDDIGKTISVMVTPRSSDGLTGEAVMQVLEAMVAARVEPEPAPVPEPVQSAGALTIPDNQPEAEADPAMQAASRLSLPALPPPPPPEPAKAVPAPTPPAVAEPAAAEPKEGDCFKIETITLENSTLLDNATRATLLDPFIGECAEPALIGEIMAALNNHYIDEGFVTTRAYVAPQDLKDGSLELVIVEGRIEEIAFADDPGRDRFRIELAFPVGEEDILNINDLERGLDQMNVPSSTKVTMNMLPGTKPGYSRIELLEELLGPKHRFKIGLDNQGSQGTGEDRLTLGYDADDLLGLNDTWSFSHIGSLDTNAIAISATIPAGYWTFGGSYSYSDYLNYIDANTQLFGRSETYEVKADRLVYKSRGDEITVKTSLNKKASRRTIGDVNLTSQNMSVGRLGLGFSHKSAAVISGNVFLAQGLKLFGAVDDLPDPAPGSPRAQFRKVQFDGSYYKPIFGQIFLQSGLAGQVASSPLYGSEQITAGGKSSVRGFARNTIAGDNGFYLQNDLLLPMPQFMLKGPLREYLAAIKPFAGVDIAYTLDRATHSENTIAGLGAGLRFSLGGLSGDLGLGVPIYRNKGSKNNRIEKYVKILYQVAEF